MVDAVKNHLPEEAALYAENHVRRFNTRMQDKSMGKKGHVEFEKIK